MKNLRLGVILDQVIVGGGGYQQALNAALLTRGLANECLEILFFTSHEQNIEILLQNNINASLIKLSFFQKIRMNVRRYIQHPKLFKCIKKLEKINPFEKILIDKKIDLVYFLAPSSFAMDLENTNYIVTVWDLSHRDQPEFPEVRWDRQFEAREKYYRSILPKATAIIVDSQLGKQNVVKRYGVDEIRVGVMPFQGASSVRNQANDMQSPAIDISNKYNLNTPYIFYPAQFWAHKNHVYILEGLKELEQRHGLKIGAIFSGGDMGNMDYIKTYTEELELNARIRFAGFVSNNEVIELYKQSIALVMPTYFGPTNLPPLEAFQLGVPVLYSDTQGLCTQVEDAALLIDIKNPTSMAEALADLMRNHELREQLIAKGKKRVEELNKIDRISIIEKFIMDFYWVRKTWV